MKKIFALTAGMLLVASLAFAKDIETGTVELAGSSNGLFSSRWSDGNTETSLNLNVAGRYYLMPNLGIGALVDYSMSSGDEDTSSFAIGPEASYNINLAEALNAYIGVNAGYFSEENGTTDNGLFAGGNGGVKFFFTDSLSLNCGLLYSHYFGDLDDNSFGVNIGLSIFLTQ